MGYRLIQARSCMGNPQDGWFFLTFLMEISANAVARLEGVEKTNHMGGIIR